MGLYSRFVVEVRRAGQWKPNEKEIFPFSQTAWQRQAGDTRTMCEFPLISAGRATYAFLANVQNDAQCEFLSECRGMPDDVSFEALQAVADQNLFTSDSTYGGYVEFKTPHEILAGSGVDAVGSWLALDELQAFDYNKTFIDRTDEEGETITYRDFLGDEFQVCLEAMATLGAPADVRLLFLLR